MSRLTDKKSLQTRRGIKKKTDFVVMLKVLEKQEQNLIKQAKLKANE